MLSFTDRYIGLPITVYNAKHKELTGQEELSNATLKVLPFEISEYYPCNDEEAQKTQIYLKNSQSYLVELTVTEFEQILNNYTPYLLA